MFGDAIDADTLHNAFHIPVDKTENCEMNWNLCKYHVILFDEVCMTDFHDMNWYNDSQNSVVTCLAICFFR